MDTEKEFTSAVIFTKNTVLFYHDKGKLNLFEKNGYELTDCKPIRGHDGLIYFVQKHLKRLVYQVVEL